MIPNPFDGIFIAFEGIDGCGKSAQLNNTDTWMNTISTPKYRSIRKAKEPGRERPYGYKIYADLVNKSTNALHKKDPLGFQTWYACDSKENLRLNIIPALKRGFIVLCDRFRPSMVYGAKNMLEIAMLMDRNREIIGEDFIWPDLILIFDLNVATAIERLKNKNMALDEHEKTEVLNRVRDNYLDFANMYPNCNIVSAEESEEQVFEKVKNLVSQLLVP